MSDRSVIEAILNIVGKDRAGQVYALDGTVKSVDQAKRTCVVEVITGSTPNEIPDVRLMAAADDGVLLIPVVDSNVCIILSSQSDPYVSQYSAIDDIILRGGDLDGLVKIRDLVTKLNNIENKVNSFINTFNTHTHNVTAVGAPTGPSLQPGPSTLTPTQQSDIENTKIKQG